jgi:hypothetical protein
VTAVATIIAAQQQIVTSNETQIKVRLTQS